MLPRLAAAQEAPVTAPPQARVDLGLRTVTVPATLRLTVELRVTKEDPPASRPSSGAESASAPEEEQ